MMQMRSMAGRFVLALGLAAGLAGCESGARQDPLLVRGSTDDIAFAGVPIFRDRTMDESIRGSLEMTDYAVALRQTGLLDTLRRNGPFTVFAVPNEPMEAAQRAASGQLLSQQNRTSLRRLMAYTIVRGHYTEPKLRRMIAAQKGPVGLTTIDGRDVLTVSADAATGQLLLSNSSGQTNRLWLADVPQSNGVLFASQSLLPPVNDIIASAMAVSTRTYIPGDYSTGVGAGR